jgi:lipopolysaccharide heptosyltransferase II
MSAEQKWKQATNILCVRLDSLGDVLMMTPAIRALKEGQPGRNITLLTSKSGAEIAGLIPVIDDTIIYDPPWMKATKTPISSKTEFEIIDRLKASRFDAAVIFTTFSQSPLPAALLAFMADIPLRLAHCRENPYHLLTQWVHEADHVDQSTVRHEVRRQLDLAASIGARTADENLSLQVAEHCVEEARQLLHEIGLDSERPWLIVHPGVTAPSRRYPAESFAEAARRLASEHDFQILFTGTQPEVHIVESIRAEMRVDSFSLAGRLGLEQFCALIALSPLLLSNNTGPVHIAAALGTPVVDLYALTNPQHTPWRVPNRVLYHDVPCRYCYKSICPLGHHNCLRLVSPAMVVDAVMDLLDEVKRAEQETPQD